MAKKKFQTTKGVHCNIKDMSNARENQLKLKLELKLKIPYKV